MNNVEPVLHKKPFHELTTDELYELLRVRSEVFVVEQNCVYQDMDGDDQKSIHHLHARRYSSYKNDLDKKDSMKKIINPWRNYKGYNCFGCCPDNPIGLHLVFYEEGDYIVSTWHPGHNYQGWVDTMHGGILSTLIDEVCGWVVTRKLQTSGYTVQLNVKFRKAVPTTETELTIRAKLTKQVRNLAYISAEITNSKGELCNEGEAVYFLMNGEKTREMGFQHCEVEE